MSFSPPVSPDLGPDPESTPDTPATAAGNRRALLVGGGVAVGLAAVAATAFLLLSGGDDVADQGSVAAARPGSGALGTPGAPSTGQPAPTPTASPTESVQAYNGADFTDPFVELVKNAGASGGGAPTDSPTDSPTDPPVDPVPGPAGTPSGQGSGKPAVAQELKMVSTSTDSATMTVDSKKYVVAVGKGFAQYYKLLAVSGECGSVQYGDVTFQLCEGDAISLR
ncbi:MAG: hypothetical protein ACRC35_05365 [Angustibacter sp.]